MPTETIAFVAAIALGLTFLASSASKLRDPGAFVLGVLDYQVLPPRLAIAYGRVLPFAELACGVALVVGVWPLGAGILSGALLLSFLIAVASNLARGRTLDCHCFGSRQSEPLGWMTVVRLCILLLCAALVAIWHGPTPLPRSQVVLPMVLLAVGLTIILYLLGTIPTLTRIWRIEAIQDDTRRTSNRVSLRGIPLEHPHTSSVIPVEAIERR